MAKRKVQSMASAIVRSLNKRPGPRGARGAVASILAARSLRSPAVGGGLRRGGGAMVASRMIAGRVASRAARLTRSPGAVASLSAARSLRSPTIGGGLRRGGGAMVASRMIVGRVASRAVRPIRSAGAVDRLVGRLASAVERRLGKPGAKAVAPPQPLSNARIVNTIAAQVASAIPPARPSAPVNVASLDATAIAATVADRITSGKIESHEPAEIVASQVVRRLSSLRIEGSAREAQDFQRRVAAAVAEVLTREGFGAEAIAVEAAGDGKKAVSKKAQAETAA